MRANFRDVYNRLNSNGEALNTAVHDVVAQLRAELREVRVVLADLTPAAPPSLTTPPSTAADLQEASGTEDDSTSPVPAPVTTVAEPDQHAEEGRAHIPIPAPRTADQDSSPSPALSVDAVRQAVREVLTDELAPVLTTLTTPDSNGDGPASDQQGVPDRLREAAGVIKEELGTALEEARSQLAALQRDIADMRAAVEELRSRPDTTAETALTEVSTEHSALLKTTARVSSASLLCHRDIWELIALRLRLAKAACSRSQMRRAATCKPACVVPPPGLVGDPAGHHGDARDTRADPAGAAGEVAIRRQDRGIVRVVEDEQPLPGGGVQLAPDELQGGRRRSRGGALFPFARAELGGHRDHPAVEGGLARGIHPPHPQAMLGGSAGQLQRDPCSCRRLPSRRAPPPPPPDPRTRARRARPGAHRVHGPRADGRRGGATAKRGTAGSSPGVGGAEGPSSFAWPYAAWQRARTSSASANALPYCSARRITASTTAAAPSCQLRGRLRPVSQSLIVDRPSPETASSWRTDSPLSGAAARAAIWRRATENGLS